jgi:hypothetical protein
VKASAKADNASKMVAPTIQDRRRYLDKDESDTAPIRG